MLSQAAQAHHHRLLPVPEPRARRAYEAHPRMLGNGLQGRLQPPQLQQPELPRRPMPALRAQLQPPHLLVGVHDLQENRSWFEVAVSNTLVYKPVNVTHELVHRIIRELLHCQWH